MQAAVMAAPPLCFADSVERTFNWLFVIPENTHDKPG